MGSISTPLHESAATKLRNLISSPGPIILAPGVYDGFSARIALSVGFDTIYMTGAGTSASRIGHADLGMASLNDMRAHAEMIANLDDRVPLIADADTGYGGPIMITRTVHQYARSGVAGLHIEDQIQTKRCGHLQGKQIVSTSEFLIRIRAANAARHAIGSDIVIIARTDALQSLGYAESIARLRLAKEAGADVGFLEGITNKEEARAVVKDLAPWPILLNMVEHGATPSISVAEAQDMGFRIVIFPFAGLAPAYKAMQEVYQRLKTKGITGAEAQMTPIQLFEVSGLKKDLEIDAKAGGTTFAGGV